MARIEASTHVEAPPGVVWGTLEQWEAQPAWMVDARSCTVRSPQRAGLGTVVRCRTDLVAGIAVDDDMVVTEWRAPEVLAVRHLGQVIRGVGAFELEPTPHGTHLTWWEEVEAPLWMAGEAVTQVLVAPFVRRRFQRSLANLKRLCEARAPGS